MDFVPRIMLPSLIEFSNFPGSRYEKFTGFNDVSITMKIHDTERICTYLQMSRLNQKGFALSDIGTSNIVDLDSEETFSLNFVKL